MQSWQLVVALSLPGPEVHSDPKGKLCKMALYVVCSVPKTHMRVWWHTAVGSSLEAYVLSHTMRVV
jgi:hypothetical protein